MDQKCKSCGLEVKHEVADFEDATSKWCVNCAHEYERMREEGYLDDDEIECA